MRKRKLEEKCHRGHSHRGSEPRCTAPSLVLCGHPASFPRDQGFWSIAMLGMESRALHRLGKGSPSKLHSQPLNHILKEPCLFLWLPLNLSHELDETIESPDRRREGGGIDQASSNHRVSLYPLSTDTGGFVVLIHFPGSLEESRFCCCCCFLGPREKMLTPRLHSPLTGQVLAAGSICLL